MPEGGSFLTPAGPRILAHRGFAIEAPENTLLAFRLALAAGATHLETDVRCTRDGVAVISHDREIPGTQERVAELSMAELARVPLGGGEGYCSLEEALRALPAARFNIDVKSADALDPVAAAVHAAGAAHRVLLTSFSESRRRRAARLVPGAVSSASARGVALGVVAVATRQRWLLRRVLRGVHALQVPERVRGVRILTDAFITAAHGLGIEVHVWTVNDPAQMQALLARGVDGLVTDRTDLAVAAVRAQADRDGF